MKPRYTLAAFLIVMLLTSMSGPQFKTNLAVTVRDGLGNTVDSVSVKLFFKQEDYLKETNVAYEAFTDKKGIARFKGLEPVSYFLLARKGDLDNAGGGEQIGKLEEGKFNKSTVVIQ